jgi:hypothetical protein
MYIVDIGEVCSMHGEEIIAYKMWVEKKLSGTSHS